MTEQPRTWELPVPHPTVDAVWDRNGARWNRRRADDPLNIPGGMWEVEDLEAAAKVSVGYGRQVNVMWSWANVLGSFGPLSTTQPPTPMEVIRAKVHDWANDLDEFAPSLNDHALPVVKAMREWLEQSR